MKTNNRMVSSNKVVEAIRTSVREEVVKAYTEWHRQYITFEEFGTWMFDIRLTSLSIVRNMEYFGIISENEREPLDRFIRSLTEVY